MNDEMKTLWNLLLEKYPELQRLTTYIQASKKKRFKILQGETLPGDRAFALNLLPRINPPGLRDLLADLCDKVQDLMFRDFGGYVRREPGKIELYFGPHTPIRVEHLFTPNDQESRWYILGDIPIKEVLEMIDLHNLEMFQRFDMKGDVGKSAYSGEVKVFIHDQDGNLLDLGKQPNPFPFSLKPKYEPLRIATIQDTWGKYRDNSEVRGIDRVGSPLEDKFRDGRHFWDLGEWEVDRLFLNLLRGWKGQNPSGYLKQGLERRTKNVLRDKYLKKSESFVSPEETEGSTSLDEERLNAKTEISRIMENLDDLDNGIVEILSRVVNPPSDAEISQELGVPARTIGYRRKRLKKIFRPLIKGNS